MPCFRTRPLREGSNSEPGDIMTIGRERVREDWLDFIVDTLKHLDESVQGAFLKEFLLRLVSLEASEKDSISHWHQILAHQVQLTEKLHRPVTLRTAAVDYFEELRLLRSPILMEYGELKRLQYNAATDPLTGLNNRRVFQEHLHREISRATRYGTIFSLLSLDLRKFKSVNDTYGHAVGDEILKCAARACNEVIRGSDVTCRTGGDEFVILLPQAERPSAEMLAERIARKFEEIAHVIAPNTAVAIDYGIAIFPEDGHDAVTLFAAVDKILYANKHRAHRQLTAEGRLSPETTPNGEQTAGEEGAEQGAGEKPQAGGGVDSVGPAEVQVESPGTDRGPGGRRDDRIKLEGTPALGVVRVGGKSSAVRVLNISNGGVCLLADQVDLPESFTARLQVPLAPTGELILRRIYSIALPEGKRKVGCSFTPDTDPLPV